MNEIGRKNPLFTDRWYVFEWVRFCGILALSFSFGMLCWTPPSHSQESSTGTTSYSTHDEIGSQKDPDRDPRYPYYQTARPRFGAALHGGIQNAGSLGLAGASLRLEWQPPWVQKYGILSLGVLLDWPYGLIGGGLGGVLAYQFRYFRNQFVVPYGGYQAAGYLSGGLFAGSSTTGMSGTWTGSFGHSVFGGLAILLNFFDEDSAAQFFVNIGVLRSYLVAEARYTLAPLPNGYFGPSYFGGVRFEF